MNMGEQLGVFAGGYFGSRTAAKGYDKAKDWWHEKYGERIDEVGNRIDPSHARRKFYGDQAYGIMSGKIDYQETPDFKFRREMGLQGLERSMASQGLSMSGSAMASAMKFNMGEAYQGLQTHLDRLGNWGSLGQQAGIAAGQAMGNMYTAQAQGIADAYIGRGAMQGQSQAILGHGLGQQADNIAKSIMSDARLKKNIKRIGKDGDLNKYKWEWNALAKEKFGLEGEDTGYLAQEVKKVMPEAVTTVKGYMAIDYGYLHSLEEVA